MTLRERQSEFLRAVAQLILFAYSQGYELTLRDGYRDPRVFGQPGESRGYGAARSYHKQRLAIDLNLFRNGRFLSSTESHRPLGEEWERMGGTWGGRFAVPDGNHYSWGESR